MNCQKFCSLAMLLLAINFFSFWQQPGGEVLEGQDLEQAAQYLKMTTHKGANHGLRVLVSSNSTDFKVIGHHQDNECFTHLQHTANVSSLDEDAVPCTMDQMDTLRNLIRNLNGVEVNVSLDGRFKKSIRFNGHEYPISIWEAYPNVLFIQKYFEEERERNYSSPPQSFLFERPVMDRIEFFDARGSLISTFNLDENNPYLRSSGDIHIRPYYSDAENTFFSPTSEMEKGEKISTHFVNTVVEQQGAFTRIAYRLEKVTNKGKIKEVYTTLVVLSDNGETLFNYETENLASLPAISDKGQYLMFAHLPLETAVNTMIKTHTEGFQIWDIAAQSPIYKEENDDPNMYIATPHIGTESGYLIIDYTYPNSTEIADKVYLFDPISLNLYSRIRTRAERKELVDNWFSNYKNDYRKVLEAYSYTSQNLKK
jgi:hypothetical protein